MTNPVNRGAEGVGRVRAFGEASHYTMATATAGPGVAGVASSRTSGSGATASPASSHLPHSPAYAVQHLTVGGAALGSARERAAHAVDFYNSHVLRTRLQAGLTGVEDRPHSARPNHQHPQHTHSNNRRQLFQPHVNVSPQDALYRSNSSLELQDHIYHYHKYPHQHPNPTNSSPLLRREYGSHGSINVVSDVRPSPVVGISESFFAMLQDYRPVTLIGVDQRSPGPSEYLRGHSEQPITQNVNNGVPTTEETSSAENTIGLMKPGSPKLKYKLQRLLGHGSSNSSSSSGKGLKSCASAQSDDALPNTSSASADIEENQRRRCFAHYDCQSMTTNLSYAARLREQLLTRRRNTTTGASAASMSNTRSSTPDGESDVNSDPGDGIKNDLVDSCSFFRNEIGGEEERIISLTARKPHAPQQQQTITNNTPMHQPGLAYGFAVLDYPPGSTHWKRGTCPYQRLPRPVETIDHGAMYYRSHFMGKDHQNFFGTDDQLGPLAISIRRERVGDEKNTASVYFQYRVIIRTSELLTLRGTVLEESVPNLKVSSHHGKIQSGVKEILEYIAPEIQINCLRLGDKSEDVKLMLATLDEQGLTSQYKVGILYCRAGQCTEEEMYNNESAGPAFVEFLGCLGKTVRLLGFPKYRAGLDNKTDSTGLHSVYAEYKDNEIMFHVATMLPYLTSNRQQLLRKQHVGNDIVTIVFQEPGALPFTPKTIVSKFQHVFIVVQAINPCTENTHYKVAVSRSKDVPIFGPPIKEGAIYPKSKTFADFLLAKVINAENAAHQSEKFATMARRTRLEYIKDLINSHSTNITVESGQKFTFFNKTKKEKGRLQLLNHNRLTGAICWQVLVDDNGTGQRVEAFLGLSTDSIVLIEESSKQIIFVAPCSAILGYTTQTNSLKIYHHQGENFTIHIRETNSDRDELMEIVDRLKIVTPASVTQEMILRRDVSGNLGFHVQPDGLITHVEPGSKAEVSGLLKGARLVEVCKIALCTLSHEAMIDFLKTSETVTISMIPPLSDGEMRRGCSVNTCRYVTGLMESDYENLSNDENNRSPNRHNAQLQHPVHNNHRRRYDRSFSPPRSSSSSSGYGTGSSSRSFLGPDIRFSANPEGTMNSSSSGHSSDDRWYELLETQEPEVTQDNLASNLPATPPPLPIRSTVANPTVMVISAEESHDIPGLPSSSFLASQRLDIPENMVASMQHLPSSSNHYSMHSQHAHEMQSHARVQVSHSLPLPHVNFSLPLNSSTHNTQYSILRENDRKHKKTSMANTHEDYMSLDDIRLLQSHQDGHSDTNSSIGDKLSNLHLEDDVPSSGHSSPRRSGKHRGTSSTSNSRNQSPRPNQSETRLRPGVVSRSNRNSANLSCSTLQEDLMKLINPDYMPEDDAQFQNSNLDQHKMNNITAMRPKTINNPGTNSGSKRKNILTPRETPMKPRAEVIFTTARPATVISNASTASSPAPSDFKIKEESLPPSRPMGPSKHQLPVSNNGHEPLPLPDEELDWSSLVDTATRAMQQVPNKIVTETHPRYEYNEQWLNGIDLKEPETNGVVASTDVPELQCHLSELETRVTLEQRRRKSLEEEIKRLREENRRLQDESQAAAHQLKRFTEWFFQTIDRQ